MIALSLTRIALLASIALILPLPSYAQEAAKETAKPAIQAEKAEPKPWLYEGSDVPVDKSWTFGKLSNGVRYAVKSNLVPPGQVSIRVRVDAGALHENDTELGYAHLIEHLSFRGSANVPDGESKRIWQRLGVTFGSDSNAQTTPTQTVYKLDLPNAKPASLDESVKIIAGMLRAPNITDTALNAERSIVQAELRESSGTQMEYADKRREHFFQGQRLAKRATIGTIETLNASNADNLRAFHNRWYRPENTVVVMAGDIDAAALEALVKKHFSSWKGTGVAGTQPDFGKPELGGKSAATMVAPTLPKLATIIYSRPWEQVNDTIVYNEGILTDLLALQMINRRLEAQARNGASFTIASVNHDDVSRSADITSVDVRPIGDDWEKAITDVRKVIADAMVTPPSKADIERELALFGNSIRTSLESYPFQSAAVQADEIVRAVDIRETVAAPETVLQVFTNMRAKFTPERILASTQNLFKADAVRIFLSTPTAVPNAENRLAQVLTMPVSANSGARIGTANLTFDALPKLGKPGTYGASVKDPIFETEQINFANGARVLLASNKAESGQIRMLVRFGRGYQALPPQKAGLLWSGPMILPDNGIGKFGRTDIDQLTNGRRIELNFAIDNDAFELSATTRPEDLADQLKLIATKLEYPGWRPGPVERVKALVESEYASYEMSASAVLGRDLNYLLSSRDPRWKSPDPKDVQALTPKSFQTFWQPLLASGPVEVIIFGDFDRAAALTALQSTIGAMKPRKAAPIAAGSDKITFPAANSQPLKLTHKGASDQVAAAIAWPTGGGIDTIAEGRRLEILAAIFRDRLFEKFRAEQAASYSPDMASSWPDKMNSGGYLLAYSQVQPKDVDRFYAFAAEVAADLKAKAVSADELQRAVEPQKQFIERIMSGNYFWMTQLKGATYNPKRYTSLRSLYSDFSRVTPEQLQSLAQKYFRDDTSWKLLVEPEKK